MMYLHCLQWASFTYRLVLIRTLLKFVLMTRLKKDLNPIQLYNSRIDKNAQTSHRSNVQYSSVSVDFSSYRRTNSR